MPTSRSVFGGGTKAEAMEANLAKINDLWKEHGTEGLQKILITRMTSRELKQKYGLDSGEKADYVISGAMVLGPEIAALVRKVKSGELPGLEQGQATPPAFAIPVQHMQGGGLMTAPTPIPIQHFQGGGAVDFPGFGLGAGTMPAVPLDPNVAMPTPALRAQPASPMVYPAFTGTPPPAPVMNYPAFTGGNVAPRAQPAAPRGYLGDEPLIQSMGLGGNYVSPNLSGQATNFGHDINGKPDQYMLKTLGPSSRIGAFGQDVTNPNLAGVSLPKKTIYSYIGNYQKNPQVRRDIASGRYKVEVTAPNGTVQQFPIVDVGPGPDEPGKIDLTGTAYNQLGVKDNFNANFRIVDTQGAAD